MSEKKELELAFPLTDGQSFATNGMTKRFYATCAAMQGMLSNHLMIDQMTDEAFKYLIERSYKCADELLKQENE